MRRSQPRPCFGCEQPDASGRNEFRKSGSIHGRPLQTPKTKRPRVWRPEGVRVASGDRGDRSPRRDQSIMGTTPARSCLSARMNRPASRPLRDAYGLFKLAGQRDMESFFIGLSPGWRRTRTIRALIIWCKHFIQYPEGSYNQPFCRASRNASIRFATPSLPIASER